MTQKSHTERILNLIKERPGIRSIEIETELDVAYVSARLKSYVDSGYLLKEDVQAPSGRMVASYTVNPQFETVKKVRDNKTRPLAGVTAALYTNGDLVIEKGNKTIRLQASETRDLVAYLDRINVEQILGQAERV